MQKNHSKVTQILSLVVLIGILVVISVSILLAVMITHLSHDAATDVYPELAYMQVPILAMALSIIALFIIACVLGFAFVVLIMRGGVYSKRAIQLMRYMGLCFFMIVVPLIIFHIYTYLHQVTSISNLYALFAAGVSFVIACIFFLFAGLIEQGSHYKEENDLTI